jgi:hypothetical protein
MKILIYNKKYGYCHYSADYIYKTDWALCIHDSFNYITDFYGRRCKTPFKLSKNTETICIHNCNSYKEFKEQFPELFI